jgi:hypothetical protein
MPGSWLRTDRAAMVTRLRPADRNLRVPRTLGVESPPEHS